MAPSLRIRLQLRARSSIAAIASFVKETQRRRFIERHAQAIPVEPTDGTTARRLSAVACFAVEVAGLHNVNRRANTILIKVSNVNAARHHTAVARLVLVAQ